MTDMSSQLPATPTNWSKWLRQVHRWTSMVFLAVVAAAFAAGHMLTWLYYVPLLPLFLLMATGLYMFALPHAQAWRAARSRR